MRIYKVTINSSYGSELLALARSEAEAAANIETKYGFVVLSVQEVKP